MNIRKLKSTFHSELGNLFPETEINSFFYILLDFHLGMTRVDLALQPNFELKSDQISFFTLSLKKLKEETPVQYITGKTEFYSLPFYVNKDVLIPRPETEELVQWILDDHQDKKNLEILDIGTGSGCIAISLTKNGSDYKTTAIDFSKTAIATAKKNAKLNKVSIDFLEQDILKTTSLSKQFDIIVSNPPYVRELEKKEMHANVLEYEPHSALFVKNENPLVFYKKIAELAKNHLKSNGKLYFEINQYLGKETIAMLKEEGFSKNELRKDLFGNDRMTRSSF